MENKYKKIEVKNVEEPESIIDVTLEDVTDVPEEKGVTIDLSDKDTPTGDDEDKGSTKDEEGQEEPETKEDEKTLEKKEDKNVEKPKKEDKRKSRAKERIKQLHSEKTDLAKQLEDAERAKQELEAKLFESSKTTTTSMKQTLETNLKNINQNLKTAMEDGDSDSIISLQDDLMTTKMQLAGLESQLSNMPEKYEAPQKQQTQQQSQEIPEKALDWIEEYPQFKTDQLFYVSSLTVSNQLVSEGFDDQSDEFYEELNKRLSPRFPEVFGTQEENSVKSDTNASQEDNDGKQDSSTTSDEDNPTPKQTVSGGSRPPSSKTGKSSKRNDSVTLSPEMVKQAERWGLSLEQMARRVAHNEKNARGDGYVPIVMKKNV